jgi:hypothetical protein
LEDECAAYVAMSHLNSPVWNPVRERLLEALKEHIDKVLKVVIIINHGLATKREDI